MYIFEYKETIYAEKSLVDFFVYFMCIVPQAKIKIQMNSISSKTSSIYVHFYIYINTLF